MDWQKRSILKCIDTLVYIGSEDKLGAILFFKQLIVDNDINIDIKCIDTAINIIEEYLKRNAKEAKNVWQCKRNEVAHEINSEKKKIYWYIYILKFI